MKLPKPPESTAGPKTPKSLFDTIITSTPVVMTVLATILAGLSSSEMSQAQYYRSLSAQNQSKAGDQWGFYQAKKTRAVEHVNTLALMQNLGDVGPLSGASFTSAAAHLVSQLESAGGASPALESARKAADGAGAVLADEQAARALTTLTAPLPPATEATIKDEHVRRAYEVVKNNKADAADPAVWSSVTAPALREALTASDDNAQANDAALKADVAGLPKLEKTLDDLAKVAAAAKMSATTGASHPATAPANPPAAGPSDRTAPGEVRQLAADFTAARLKFDAARYDREAKLNQQTAYLYEVAVRQTSWQSERCRIRSRYFFYGMLGAQAAVTIATLSLAVRERSWMWSVAASIGVLAMMYAAYVYLFT